MTADDVTAVSGALRPHPEPAPTRTAAAPLTLVVDRAEIIGVAVEAAARGALAMFAGFVATVALGLLLWAVAPGTDLGAEPAVRAATAAYVLAHFGHVGIDGASLTLSPLLLPLLFGLLLAVGPGRGRALGSSATGEAVSVAAGAVSYAALVVVAAVTLAPPGVGVLGAAIGALVVSGTALGLGVLRRGPRLRELLAERLPLWATAGAAAGGAAALTVVAGAGLVFVVALGRHFTTAADLASTLSAGGGDAVGLALAGLAYLPNAILATVGYVTGVGFEIGPGRYSPFGSVPADLPPFPLLAAVPGSTGVSALGVATLIVPLAAGLVAGFVVQRRVTDRRDRFVAVAVAAGVAGLLGGLLVWAAAGGVSGGPWPHIGAVGGQVGPVLALAVLVVGWAWVAAAGRSVAVAGGSTGEALDAPADSPRTVDPQDVDSPGDDPDGHDLADHDPAGQGSDADDPADHEPADEGSEVDPAVEDSADVDESGREVTPDPVESDAPTTTDGPDAPDPEIGADGQPPADAAASDQEPDPEPGEHRPGT